MLARGMGEILPRFTRLIVAVAGSLCALALPARADVVSDWNEAAVAAGYKAQLTPVPSTRNIALMHVAMFEAANAIVPRYQAYRRAMPPPVGVDAELAAAAAARAVLATVYAEQSAVFDALYEKTKARVQIDAAPSEAYGGTVAQAMLAERANDNVDMQETFRPDTRPGVYLPTPIPVGSTCAAVTPWTLKDVKQFRPPPPYRLSSEHYAQDLNELATVGGKRGTAAKIVRSDEQTQIAKFWEFIGPGTYSPIARQWVAARQVDLVDSARLFALLAMATADAYVAVFEAKYHYNFWRPVTAIRNADQDNNSATTREASWLPLLDTPLHPEYPCAHCISSAAAAGVLARVFGSAKFAPFSLQSPTAPSVTRTFASLDDYVTEVMNARVWGGIHFRASTEIGRQMGEKIAAQAVENFWRPR